MNMPDLYIRKATADDAPLILQFIKELAVYEKMESEVVTTVEGITSSLFSPEASAGALICMINGEPAGYAVYFFNYSTWLGKNGLYLEDLYVSPTFRHQGAGRKMLQYLAAYAVEKGCGRFEWSVLDWNEPAIQFYRSVGAKPLDEWIIYRLTGKALDDFAAHGDLPDQIKQ